VVLNYKKEKGEKCPLRSRSSTQSRKYWRKRGGERKVDDPREEAGQTQASEWKLGERSRQMNPAEKEVKHEKWIAAKKKPKNPYNARGREELAIRGS